MNNTALQKPNTPLPSPAKPSALGVMASRLSVEPNKLLDTLKATVFRGATNEELLALVVVANEYRLNPFLKELYAFPAKGGGIVPVVSIDGWIQIVNRQEQYDGIEFAWDSDEAGKPISCTCSIYIKGRTRPVVVTEFTDECFRPTDPWKNMPKRMLRHKALIQCARIAFGLSGIFDEDEGRDQAASVPPAVLSTINTDTITEPPALAAPPAAVVHQDSPATTIQQDLQKVVEDAGFSFDNLREWGEATGNIQDASSIGSWDELPKDIARRLLRNKAGLIQGLEMTKPA